jgi:hypothetical protein
MPWALTKRRRRYWLQAPWGWHDSVETFRSVIICEIVVHVLVRVQSKKTDQFSYIHGAGLPLVNSNRSCVKAQLSLMLASQRSQHNAHTDHFSVQHRPLRVSVRLFVLLCTLSVRIHKTETQDGPFIVSLSTVAVSSTKPASVGASQQLLCCRQL